jgi:acetyltransferase-like isoleucine patch superfamily enzyme
MTQLNNRSNFRKLLAECQTARISIILVAMTYIGYRLRKKNILASNKVTIYGLKNISTLGLLRVGLANVGFMNRYDQTFLNIAGKIDFKKNFSIGRGCRFDIGPGAIATFGSGYVAALSKFIIMHGLTVGDGCAISWGCQFLDDDFHNLDYAGKKEKSLEIVIGSHVWIGSNVSVLKGAMIPDGCVVASGSVVGAKFTEKNLLIAGNPARVIRKNIAWN